MFIQLVVVVFLFTESKLAKGNSSVGARGAYFCGDKMERYNRATQDCINKTVKPKIFYQCGYPPKVEKYNTNTHSCINYTIVEKPDVEETITKVERLMCGHKELSRRQKCCGDKIYDPRYQTCCSSKHMHKIHDHKPEAYHVCCRLQVYNRRSAEAACHSSAHNDQFFKKRRLRKVNQKICKIFDQVYKIRVKEHVWRDDRRFLRIIVSRWSWNPLRSTRLPKTNEKRHMRVKLDKYSGKRDLTGKSFLIFTDQKYPMGKVFHLRFRENLYSIPKRKTMQIKLLRNVSRKCKKLLNGNG